MTTCTAAASDASGAGLGTSVPELVWSVHAASIAWSTLSDAAKVLSSADMARKRSTCGRQDGVDRMDSRYDCRAGSLVSASARLDLKLIFAGSEGRRSVVL